MIGPVGATNGASRPEPAVPTLVISARYLVVANEPFVAVGLLTETNIRMLGPSLRQVFPIPRDDKFDDLLKALDQARSETRQRG